MTTEEAKRHGLYNVLSATIGAEETETLMAYLPTQPNEVLVTKTDLDLLASKADFRAVEGRLTRLESQMDAFYMEMGALRADLGGRIDSVNRRLDRLFLTLAAGLLAVVGTVIFQAFQ